MDKIKLHIEKLLQDHEQAQYCTKWTQAQAEKEPKRAIRLAYDVGQYELLKQLLDDIDTLQAHKENEKF
jgi:hypothetical protein